MQRKPNETNGAIGFPSTPIALPIQKQMTNLWNRTALNAFGCIDSNRFSSWVNCCSTIRDCVTFDTYCGGGFCFVATLGCFFGFTIGVFNQQLFSFFNLFQNIRTAARISNYSIPSTFVYIFFSRYWNSMITKNRNENLGLFVAMFYYVSRTWMLQCPLFVFQTRRKLGERGRDHDKCWLADITNGKQHAGCHSNVRTAHTNSWR